MPLEESQTASIEQQSTGTEGQSSLSAEMQDEINKVNGGGNYDQESNEEEEENAVNPDDQASRIEKVTEHERNLFRERKSFSDREKLLKEEIESLKAGKASGKNEESDDAMKMLNAIMNGEDTESENQEPDENAPLTRAQLMEILKENKENQDKEHTQQESEYQEKQAVDNFKHDLSGQIQNFATEMPLLATMGDSQEQAEEIYSLIEEDYLQNVEEFGEDYASKNLMEAKEASGLMQNYLAEKFKTMLKSDSIRNLFNTYISELGGSPQQDFNQTSTLTNANTSSSITTGEDDEDARIARAMQAI